MYKNEYIIHYFFYSQLCKNQASYWPTILKMTIISLMNELFWNIATINTEVDLIIMNYLIMHLIFEHS